MVQKQQSSPYTQVIVWTKILYFGIYAFDVLAVTGILVFVCIKFYA